MSQKCEIDVRATSVQVSFNGGVVTKVVLPDDAVVVVNIQPSMLSAIADYEPRTISSREIAKEYLRLVKTDGTIEDLRAFCGGQSVDDFLIKMKEVYFTATGKALPQLKRKKINNVIIDKSNLVAVLDELISDVR